MADLPLDSSAQPVVLVGATSTGLPTNPAAVDVNGNVQTVINNTSANPVPVTSVGTAPDFISNGTITALNGTVQVSGGFGQSDWTMTIGGTLTAGTTITFEASQDGTTYIPVNGRLTGNLSTVLASSVSGPQASPVVYRGNISGMKYFRARASAFHAGDSVTVSITASTGVGSVFLNASLPYGVNTIGKIIIQDAAGNSIGSVNSAGNYNLAVAQSATNYIVGTTNSTTAQLASGATYTGAIDSIYNQQAISVLLTTDQVGILTLNQYIDAAGVSKSSTFLYTVLPNQPFSRSFVANGNYFNLSFKNTGLAATTTLNIDTAYGTLPSSSNMGNSSVSLDEASGVALSARPDGFFRVANDPTTLLLDSFETLDTTVVWSNGGTNPPTTATGALVLSPGATANMSAYLQSKPTFKPVTNAFIQYFTLIKLESGIVTGNRRWWGLAAPGTPTFALPSTDAVLFEIDPTSGLLNGVIYSGGVKTQSIPLIRSVDGTLHRYAIFYKSSKVYFEIDGVNVGSGVAPNLSIAALSAVVGSFNGATPPSATPQLACTVVGLGDSGRNGVQIVDGKYGFQRAVVNSDGSFNVAGSVPSGTADSGNPVKIGGVYNSTPLAVSSGQRVDLQLDATGRLLTSSVSLPTTASKFTFGKVDTSTLNTTPVLASTYNEQKVNTTMKIVSNNAADAAAGTGARQVIVTYLDSTGAGPFTTTIALNGTTAVSASVSNMCFIEKMVIVNAGTSGSNTGTLTLQTAAGATVGTINPTDNQTFWSHHYVPTGKTAYITGIAHGNTSPQGSTGCTVFLKAYSPTVTGSAMVQVSDFINVNGGSSTVPRAYGSPIQVVGPARVVSLASPQNNSTFTTYVSFDYIDN